MDHTSLQQIAAIDDPIDRLRALSHAMDDQQQLLRQVARMRRQAVAAARAKGYRLDQIAEVLGVTPGRVSQMGKGHKTRQPSTPAAPDRPAR